MALSRLRFHPSFVSAAAVGGIAMCIFTIMIFLDFSSVQYTLRKERLKFGYSI